jgi:uncharacterized protein YacL
MWIVEWLPSWLFLGLLLISLVVFTLTYFLRFIPLPALYLYKIPIQIVTVIIAAICIYLLGARANETKWQERVKALEAKVAEAEAKSQQVTKEIVEKVVVKNNIIKQRGEEIVKYVDREIVKYNNICEIPEPFVDAHNRAAGVQE